MKVKTSYICELCNNCYDTEDKANTCESSHMMLDTHVESVKEQFVHCESTPWSIDIKYTNGTKFRYERTNQIL